MTSVTKKVSKYIRNYYYYYHDLDMDLCGLYYSLLFDILYHSIYVCKFCQTWSLLQKQGQILHTQGFLTVITLQIDATIG